MFANAIKWLRLLRKAFSGERFEQSVIVSVDHEGISAVYPSGDTSSIKWPNVGRIGIQTNDKGPWQPDVWWILEGASNRCTYPNGATGEHDALKEIESRFPGFDDKAVIKAMGCSSNAVFMCWERKNAL